jgi:hypothetical protein
MNNSKPSQLQLALGALAASLILPSSLFGSCGADLSTQFHIQPGPQGGRNGVVYQTVDITNLGATSKGPYYFVVENMPAGVSESPYTWTAACEPGAEFIRIYLGWNNTWAGGATQKISLAFYGAQSVPVNYTYRITRAEQLQSPHFVPGDFDGDRIADFAMYNPSSGNWTIRKSTTSQVTTKLYGNPNIDIFVVGDFDGDLKQDLALYRANAGFWFYIQSSDGQAVALPLGTPNVDKPVPGDYDGDGYTDLAVYNPNTGVFTVKQSTNGQIITKQIGAAGDIPVVADYDGDGKTDFAVFRPALYQFLVLYSGTNKLAGFSMMPFKDGIPFAADFNNDGAADMCTYNPITGYVTIAYSHTNTHNTVYMGPNSKPVVADFNGDFHADFALYDPPSAHWALDSQMNAVNPVPVAWFVFGTPPHDIPVMAVPASLPW